MGRHYHKLGGMPQSEFPYLFHVDNHDKKSLAVDLRKAEGQDLIRRLVATADVFLSNRRGTALQEFGMTYEELREINPGLIYVHGTGYGDRGPEVQKPGYDAVCYWSRSGIEAQIFPIEGWLGPLPWASGDHPSSLAVFGAVMLALFVRERTGQGCKIPLSLLACGAWANSSTIAARLCDAEFPELGPREALHYTWLCYLTSDQRMVKLCIPDEAKKWSPLCDAVGRPDLRGDPRFAEYEGRVEHMVELIGEFDAAFAEHDLAHWKRRLEEHDIPHTHLSDYDDIAADEQMAANEILVDCEQPGFDGLRTVNTPIEIDGVDKLPPGPFPELGEHTRELMLEVGYSDDQVEGLADSGTVEVFRAAADR